MVFHWSLSNRKSPQVFRAPLNILANIIFTPLEFFTSALADGFSQEFE